MNMLGGVRLSDNFMGHEFACPGESKGMPCCCHGAINIDGIIVEVAQEARTHIWQRPLKIMSGFRCDKYNTAIDGYFASAHRLGMAADLRVSELVGSGTSKHGAYVELAEKILKAMDVVALRYGEDKVGRCIVYPKRGFIHVDMTNPPDRIKTDWGSPKMDRRDWFV